MKRMCRETFIPGWRRQQLAIAELLHHARIVTDPVKLARLSTEIAKRKARSEADILRGRM
jgi:hypothetical protein